MVFTVAEPTLGPEVANLLESLLGTKVAQQGVLAGRQQFDMLLDFGGYQLVVELKVGEIGRIPQAIAQAEEYRDKVGAAGSIIIVYPDSTRKTVTTPQDVEDMAQQTKLTAFVLCPFLKDFMQQVSLAELAQALIAAVEKPTRAPSLHLVINTLRQAVQGISLETKRNIGIESPVFTQTVGSLPLFKTLSGDQQAVPGSKEEAQRSSICDMAAYILVNQVLLHRLLSEPLKRSETLRQVASPAQLNSFFKEITDIDYRAVYDIDIASNIPAATTQEINLVILAIRAIQPEHLRHDLLGRIFHEFLPPDTRKQLGAFFTRPVAAEILAVLSIDDRKERVLDPACGSGTLLVAAYRRKGSLGKMRSHKIMVEQELTGIDVMPFATHLAALNLTLQSPLETTNKTRIGVGNALLLGAKSKVATLTEWAKAFGAEVASVDMDSTLSRQPPFTLQKVDTVIMNPPFTRKELLKPEMKGGLYTEFGEQNYWAYFIRLADSLLGKGGKIAAVLPRDFFRGEYSRSVRDYLFRTSNYAIRYIVKSTKDYAFSENARFRDYLVVLEKGRERAAYALVYLKKRLQDLTPQEASLIATTVRQVAEGNPYDDEAVSIVWKDMKEVKDGYRDLGGIVAFNSQAGPTLEKIRNEALGKAGASLIPLGKLRPPVRILRGLEPYSNNLLDLIFLVRNTQPKRLQHAKLVLSAEEGDDLRVWLKDLNQTLDIPLQSVVAGLKTPSYLNRIEVTDIADSVVIQPYPGIGDIAKKLGVTSFDFEHIRRAAKDRLTNLVIARRFDFTAPGTYAVAYFSNELLIPGKAFWSLSTSVEGSKALVVWLNSSLFLLELLAGQTETRGSWIEITKDRLMEWLIPDFSNVDTSYLMEAFDTVREAELIPLARQFKDPVPDVRRIIDTAALRTIGYSDAEIEPLLNRLYKGLNTEMQSVLEVMHTPRPQAIEPSLQLHLLPLHK